MKCTFSLNNHQITYKNIDEMHTTSIKNKIHAQNFKLLLVKVLRFRIKKHILSMKCTLTNNLMGLNGE